MRRRPPESPRAPPRSLPPAASLPSRTLRVLPLTAARWSDLEEVFGARGCSVARGCWCMAYRLSGQSWSEPTGSKRGPRWRSELRKLVDSGVTPGLIGYSGRIPVGWISLGPRGDYARLQRSPVMKPVDDKPVWSIVCFVVPAAYRGQGVATGLLHGATEYAARHGAGILEAYPVDSPGRMAADALWFGAKSMFDAAGFHEVARRKPARPVMRRIL